MSKILNEKVQSSGDYYYKIKALILLNVRNRTIYLNNHNVNYLYSYIYKTCKRILPFLIIFSYISTQT